MRVICPIQPGRFSWENQGQQKPAKLSPPQNLSSRTEYFLPSLFIAAEPLHHEESHLIYGHLSLLFQTKGSLLNINQKFLFRHLQEHFYIATTFCYVYSDA